MAFVFSKCNEIDMQSDEIDSREAGHQVPVRAGYSIVIVRGDKSKDQPLC